MTPPDTHQLAIDTLYWIRMATTHTDPLRAIRAVEAALTRIGQTHRLTWHHRCAHLEPLEPPAPPILLPPPADGPADATIKDKTSHTSCEHDDAATAHLRARCDIISARCDIISARCTILSRRLDNANTRWGNHMDIESRNNRRILWLMRASVVMLVAIIIIKCTR